MLGLAANAQDRLPQVAHTEYVCSQHVPNVLTISYEEGMAQVAGELHVHESDFLDVNFHELELHHNDLVKSGFKCICEKCFSIDRKSGLFHKRKLVPNRDEKFIHWHCA